jgi:hypothetical protein
MNPFLASHRGVSGRKKDMSTRNAERMIWMMKGPCHDISSGSMK